MLQDRFHLDTSDIDYIENNHFCDKIMASKLIKKLYLILLNDMKKK